jgi:hypothetical protein
MTPDELPADMEGRLLRDIEFSIADCRDGQTKVSRDFLCRTRALLNSLKWARGAGDLARQAIKNRDEDYAALLKAYQQQRRALELALDYLVEMEPGDSRAVSNEFVAMLGVLLGVEPNTPGEDMAIIEKALEAARRARAALNQKGDER